MTVPDHSNYLETRYFRALDGLRAVSILLVLVLHTNPGLWGAANGGLGVFIFFVISGYLITTLALREEANRGALSLRSFYVRRACRIFPLYYLVLLVYVVSAIGFNYRGHRDLLMSAMPYYLTYMNDFAPYFRDAPYAHSWSLGVEEKFYMLWPLLAFMFWRGRTLLRFAGTGALVVVPIVLDRMHLLPFDFRRYGTPLYYSYGAILVGCLLAFGLHHRASFVWLARLATGVPALAVLGLAIAAHLTARLNPWTFFIYPFAVALVIVPIVTGNPPWTRLLAWRPMVFIGELSYGIYLVHLICLSTVRPVIARMPGVTLDADRAPLGPHAWGATVLTFALAGGLSLAVATVLNVVIEKPCIAQGRRWTKAILAGTSATRA
jgi:peptidoglycan/LPS O-acetylase OafA/YrhL